MTTSVLELRLLGGADICVGGIPVNIPYQKGRALIALLSQTPDLMVARTHLARMFWPGLPEADARTNLRQVIAALRKQVEVPLGYAVLKVEKERVGFAPEGPWQADTLQLDSCFQDDLRAQEDAAQGYAGQFLAGLSVNDCPEFEDWLRERRGYWHYKVLAMLQALAEQRESLGDLPAAIGHARRHLQLEPWDEAGQRRLIRLYALSGQTAVALAQFETCCRMLNIELDALPSEETKRLAERIRNGELRRASLAQPHPSKAEELGTNGIRATIQQAHAERRQLTVLHCELSAATDDPEEAMELLLAPQVRCVEIIRQFSGYVVQKHGGGLLAYFGYPQASEHAARHAVQAALAITGETFPCIEIRLGVHTGLVITGAGSSVPDTSGITSRLAIRLHHGAAHNAVAISQQTYSQVALYFDCVSLCVQALPGIARPVEIFHVLRESGARNRMDAALQLTPLAGRQAETAKLIELWQETAQGMRHIVLVQGEAGIGKSRLLHTLKAQLHGQPHAIRELRCFPEFSQSPFHPLIAMLEALFGFAHGDIPEIKSGKLAQYFETSYPASAQNAVPLLTQLLSLPLAAAYQASGLSPQKQKEQTIAILLETLQALAARQPTLLILEDLHWVDHSTLELLTRFIEQTGSGAILAVLTARPEFDPPWSEALESTLTLAPLAENEAAQMVASISSDIPAATLRRIVERADGVPLFVEEMAKLAVLDMHAGIPPTLHDLLAARMDNLGEAKHTAQLAATIGREFELDLLRKVSPCDSSVLARTLRAIEDAGLIVEISETVSQFKHALIQEAAYQSQTRADRQTAHRRIAQALQSDFPDVVANQPELLAQHWAAAGEIQQAIEYWIKAAQRAAAHSANREATEHFNSSLKILMTLPAGLDRDRTEFKILVSLCPVLYSAKGYGSQEATQANARIAVLSGLVGDSPEIFPAKWTILLNTIASVGSRGVPAAAMQLLNMSQDDPIKQQAALHAATNASFWLGDFKSSVAHGERAIQLYQPAHRQVMLEQYGTNLAVFSAGYTSFALFVLGYPQRARIVSEQMLEQARETAHPHTLAQALSFAAELLCWQGKYAEALALSHEAIVIARKHDFLLWLACGEMAHGWALAVQGEIDQGIAELKHCIAGMRAALGGISVIFLASLIHAYVHLKQYEDALNVIAEAQADAEITGDGHLIAELHRLKGVSLLEISDTNTDEAEACFKLSLDVSRKQEAKTLELRASMNLARLWRQQGKQEDARRLLEEVYNWFTEGFDTPDLQEAANLLCALR